jgi:RimJ/RimL family protein N-acetyltransferase
MDFPQKLMTRRLLLTRIENADQGDFFRMRSAPEVMHALGALERDAADALCRTLAEHWTQHGYGWWTARDARSGAFMGCGGLRAVMLEGVPETELAYGFLPQFWGHGYASELARVAVAQGFVRLGVGEIVSYVLPGNHGSRRVVEKAGFACERPFMHARRQHLLYRLRACAWSTASQPRARPRAEAMLQTA